MVSINVKKINNDKLLLWYFDICLIFFKLEQMDLSVKESDVSVRAKLHNRVASYRAELHRLAKEFARAKCTVNIDLGILHSK